MRTTWTFVFVLALAACQQQPATTETSTAVAGVANDTSAARTFLAHIYSGYYPDAPLEAILPDEQVYAAPLLAAMAANSQAHDGEVGYLDSDPLCDCQDNAQDLRALEFTLTPQGNDQMRATAVLVDADEPLSLDLTLARQGDSWRIADIATARAPSLLRALESDTTEVRSAAGKS
ncbi:DUF3828 domain-containing protein [Stenotrophomonas sp. SY1]|uniref:DUF3828 domain-containing protein n=1 Tax=Stenotrophomonas sp. SY1 TaxID=477235 RepID=UPI001E3B5BCC|nr:DUF3828 domain-containing protein [Stenotrophomonas sp. SY1]MCD9085156.1 YbjP/YqhG family protein [Stenotrophomonas sp. SY1]